MSEQAASLRTTGRRERLAGLPLLAPLRVRDYRLVWFGESVSLLGDQFHYIALSWLVLELTGSGLALGTVLLASSLPRGAFLLFGGVLADRSGLRAGEADDLVGMPSKLSTPYHAAHDEADLAPVHR